MKNHPLGGWIFIVWQIFERLKKHNGAVPRHTNNKQNMKKAGEVSLVGITRM